MTGTDGMADGAEGLTADQAQQAETIIRMLRESARNQPESTDPLPSWVPDFVQAMGPRLTEALEQRDSDRALAILMVLMREVPGGFHAMAKAMEQVFLGSDLPPR
ncbi:hypothetical protein [Saccharothrix hoggarensis]|uniref:Uncharacterized protein n=1 Tax=Saccharothrix hoggarensis TaxID=913853 RepID=A0ABW3QGG6_9PSEU